MTTGFVALLAAVALLGTARSLPAQGAPTIDYATARLERKLVAIRAASAITLDGRLDEPAWRDAPVANHFIQNEPREGAPATYDTEVRVVYDDEALYIGVFAHDDQPGGIIVSDLKKDFNLNSSDGFRLIIDTFDDRRNGYQFAVNPAGARWDAQMANEGRENNSNWDGIWEAKTRITETGWYAEIWIPFRTLKFAKGNPQTWGLNFERRLRRLNENSYWSPLPRVYDLERVSLAGTLDGMQGLRPGKNLRVKPYGLSSSNTIGDVGTSGDLSGGLDVKYGVTNGLTLDFTLNTDFSQVEADEQQVNLSRFSLFFPEKRDFFLENSGIFQFGGGGGGGGGGTASSGRQNASQETLLFFSRRIGLSESGDAIPILGGTRLTGRVGRFTVGGLSIQQQRLGSVASTNFTALRVRRDILANSDIGVVLLNKDESGPRFNRVAGADANFQFGFLSLNGYAVKTFSPQVVAPGSGEDFAARGSFNYRSRTLQIRGYYSAIGSRFTDEMGYVPRVGVNNVLVNAGYAVRPKWASRFGIREIRPHWQIEAFRRRDGLAGVQLSGLAPADHFPRRRLSGGRRQPQRRGDSTAVYHQHGARRAGRSGALRVQRVLLPLEHQQLGAGVVQQPLLERPVLRWVPPRLHVGPQRPSERALQRGSQSSGQRHRSPERLVHLDAGDEPRQLQLQHAHVPERAAPVQHRLAPVELERAVQRDPSPAERHLPGLQRTARRAERRPDRPRAHRQGHLPRRVLKGDRSEGEIGQNEQMVVYGIFRYSPRWSAA